MTIQQGYDWPGRHKPFAHQKETSAFLVDNKKAFCFSEQGTGKTASAIWAADYLLKQGVIKRVLVVCPLSIMKSAWQADMFKFAMHRSCSVAYGAAKTRKKILDAGAEFVIINYDGVAILKDDIIKGGFDLVIIDEANAYKNARTKRWKIMREISAYVKWVWMMTGTPAAQSPLDAYGLGKLVNPSGTPKYYGVFRDQVMYRISHFKWAPKAQAETIVHKMLQPAIRFEKDQCLDLPPVTYLERDAPLTPQQDKYYKQLKRQLMLIADGESVTAINAAVGINKLLQISGGAVYTDSGEVIDFDIGNRIQVVLEAIGEASHKVLLFIPFLHTIELMKDALAHHHVSADVISGNVSVNKRAEIIKNFQEKITPQVLIIQPQAASHGLTLTAADTVIWYAPVTSVETYLQANARIDRPGQHHPMTVIHICGSEVEARLYRMLRDNISNHSKLIDLYHQEIADVA